MRVNRRSLLGLAAGAALPLPIGGRRTARWVPSWTSMPQLTEPGNMPPAPFSQPGRVLADATLRQNLRPTLGGPSLRLRFSNAFGGADLPITGVTVARSLGADAIAPGSARPVTFGGRASTVVPVGAQVVSDPIDLPVTPAAILTVTIYLRDGQRSDSITSHPGSRTTSYLLAGDHRADATLPGATPVDHWYFLSTAEVRADGRAAVMLGDSLTDGRGSTTNGNDRWPDRLADRLRADRRPVAVLNQAAGGNRVLHDGLGPNALARLDRDVLAHAGVGWLLVFEGVNDIGTDSATADDLIGAFEQIVVRAHAQDIRVYGATITPFGGNEGYDDPAGAHEAIRAAVNTWIRQGRHFDAVVDFDAVARDPAQPRRLRPEFDVGDHLHFNPAGYRALADSVPLRLFS